MYDIARKGTVIDSIPKLIVRLFVYRNTGCQFALATKYNPLFIPDRYIRNTI